MGVLAPLVLGYLLITELLTKIAEPYSGYPGWFLGVFGWGMVIALVVGGVLLSLVPWSSRSRAKDDVGYDDFLDQEEYAADPETASIAVPAAQSKGAGA
ncbi:Uncharacterised protein [Mycobacterium tuberculosis]|nr:Uncharacterised protein [Mycobacterium tuberculosis]